MFKAYRYTLPMNVQQLFRIHESLYTSRHKYTLKQIYTRTTLKEYVYFCYRIKTLELPQ